MSKTILIADDDPLQLELLSVYFKNEAGFVTIECSDGASAYERAVSLKPDLVVTDIRMPVMTGLELCAKLKSDPQHAHIPVMMLTQYSDPKTALLALSAGADNFIEKPYAKEHVLKKARELLFKSSMPEDRPVEVVIEGKTYPVAPDPHRILNFFTTAYEQAGEARDKLLHMNEVLERRVDARTAELQERSDEVTKSYAEIEQINYLASHHLRDPLLRMSGYFGMVYRSCRGKINSSTDRALDEVQTGLRKLETLVSDLLLYAVNKDEDFPTIPVDLADLLQEVVDSDLAEQIKTVDGQIHFQGLPRIPVNPWQMKQVFFNLLDNALRFHGPKRPVIFIRAEELDDSWKISVSDNGVGINPRYYESIFLISERVHTQVSFLGAGVGLAISRKIIERHGGKIWVESKEGVGSTFHFTILKEEDSSARVNGIGHRQAHSEYR